MFILLRPLIERMKKKFLVIQLTESDKADIIRMRKEGSTLREIAEYIGCAINTVVYHLRKTGIFKQQRWTDDETIIMITMYNDGVTCAEIGKRLNRTKGNVAHRISYLRKLGNKNIKYRK